MAKANSSSKTTAKKDETPKDETPAAQDVHDLMANLEKSLEDARAAKDGTAPTDAPVDTQDAKAEEPGASEPDEDGTDLDPAQHAGPGDTIRDAAGNEHVVRFGRGGGRVVTDLGVEFPAGDYTVVAKRKRGAE